MGLLTGDNSINGDAPVVVMTTEVLRNMIYARSHGLRDLAAVVLDEVHFLQDTYRGPVWEEVIIHLPTHVRLVCLSATVSNAHELADWISTVRGTTKAILEDRRPVRLDNLYLIGDKTHDRLHLLPTLVNGRANHDAIRLDAEGARAGKGGRNSRGGRRKLFTPSRLETVDVLEREGMLPAIYFIFSRNQCDEAARSCLAAGMRLTTGADRDRIREIVDARLGAMDPADLAVLGYGQFLAQLEAGIAAHHAGMVPPFKEVVEACFVEGLVKVVFATETLAVGINMPAKSVVIEKLSKFTGDHHTFLTPGEYTQLTGRAGRRGLDDLGHAIVLWNPFVPFDQVATLAASRTFHLNSAFRPTYNMAANLVRSYTSERAHHLLNLSFAQYQGDRDVVKIEARLERRQQHLADLIEKSQSPYGDIDDYRQRMERKEDARPTGPPGRDDMVTLAIMSLKPGDIIYAEKGRYAGRVAVLTMRPPQGRGAHHGRHHPPRTGDAQHRRLRRAASFDRQDRAAGGLRAEPARLPARGGASASRRPRRCRTRASSAAPVAEDQPITHPVEDDPELDDRIKAATQAERVAREVDELRQRVKGRSQSIARDFDRVLAILQQWGYVDGWSAHSPPARSCRARSTNAICSSSSAFAKGCSTASMRRRSPGWRACSSTSTAVRKRRPHPGTRRPRLDGVGSPWRASAYTLQDAEEARRALGAPPSRPHVRRRGIRLGRRRGLRRGGGHRGAVGRRLRAHHEAAHRSRPPDRDRGALEGHPQGGRAGGRGAVPGRRRRLERGGGRR